MDEIKLINVKEDVLADNEVKARELRGRLKNEKTFLLNIMSSPGSGKTSLIIRTIEALRDEFRTGVLEADIESIVDSEKVASHGITAVQLRTGGFCHLDASMVTEGLDALDINSFDLVLLENVGNLVCPAEFDTGAIKSAMLLSVPEGDDKPLKYPLMFSVCDAIIVNKIDYLEQSDFNMEAFRQRIGKLNSKAKIFELSCKTKDGIPAWTDWLKQSINEFIA